MWNCFLNFDQKMTRLTATPSILQKLRANSVAKQSFDRNREKWETNGAKLLTTAAKQRIRDEKEKKEDEKGKSSSSCYNESTKVRD